MKLRRYSSNTLPKIPASLCLLSPWAKSLQRQLLKGAVDHCTAAAGIKTSRTRRHRSRFEIAQQIHTHRWRRPRRGGWGAGPLGRAGRVGLLGSAVFGDERWRELHASLACAVLQLKRCASAGFCSYSALSVSPTSDGPSAPPRVGSRARRAAAPAVLQVCLPDKVLKEDGLKPQR